MIQSEDSRFDKVLVGVAERSIFELGIDSAVQKQARAVRGFEALGSIATPAIPSLIKLLRSVDAQTGKGAGVAAADALAQIGSESVPALVQALSDTNKWTRFYALAVGDIRPLARSCVPELVKRLKDEEHNVRWAAAITLGGMAQEPEIVVPALMESLSATNRVERYSAIRALGRFGRAAQAAVPALQNILQTNTNDRTLTTFAAQALKSIEIEE